MSLKAFHIIFVLLTTLLCLFVAGWGFYFAAPSVASFARKLAYVGVAGAILMPCYGVFFYNKVKNLSTTLSDS